MDKLLHLLLPIGVCLFIVSLPTHSLHGQCQNQERFLDDTSVPVNGDPRNAYCFDFTFDPDQTGYPIGISFFLEHTFEGDIGVFVLAGGNTLNVVQRPGAVGNCNGGCPCGSGANISANYEFTDGGGPDPENGMTAGGAYGITADDACGVGTPGINTFADLWGAYGPGIVNATICIADHAGADEGPAADLTFIFPNPVVCGCTDPFAVNYDPTANVDDGSCLFCDFLDLQVFPDFFSSCPGAMIQLEAFTTATDPTWEWVGQNGEEDFMDNPFIFNPTVTIPPDFTGTIIYTVTVTDNIGCTESWDVTIDVQPPFDVFIEGESFVCSGGFVDLLTNPRFFSAYQWSTGENSDQISVGPGTYEVTVFDFNGCQATADFTVEEYPEVFPEITGPQEVCNGGGGNITLGLNDSYLTYNWSTGETTEEIIVTAAGPYEVTVTDFNGCEGTAFTVLTERDPLDVPIFGEQEFCDGTSTTLEVDSGWESFQWSTGDGSFTTEVFTSGTVTVTVVDSDGCEGEGSIVVEAISAPVPTIDGPVEICPNASTTLEVVENFSSYQWSDFSTEQSIDIDVPGVYSVTVTDANNCEGTAEVIVGTAPVPDIAISGDLEFCAGSSAELTVTAGYDSYAWSSGSTDPTTTVDMGGTYTVTVTNTEGCSSTADWTIDERALPRPTITGELDVCPGETSELTGTAGFASYRWSTGEQASNTIIVGVGNYELTVTDDLGCEGTTIAEVIELTPPNPMISGELDFCVNESSVLTTVVTYDAYEWSTGDLSPSITVGTPGLVTVTVTDENGCTGTTQANLTEIVPSVNILGETTFCEDQQTTLSLDGTFASYDWSTGANTPTVDVNTPGTVSITVLDENGCAATDELELTTWPLPPVDITGRLTFCPGTEASLDATPGYATYAWSNNANTASITTATAGSYTVTVTDSNGCQNTATTEVLEEENLSPTIDGDLSFCTGTSTQLTGEAGYQTYNWSNGQTGANLTVTEPGPYTLSVTDAFGCSGEVTVNVSTLALPTPTINGDREYCADSNTLLTAGETYASYQWTGGATDPQITVTNPGDYRLTVTDANGCVGTTAVTVVENPLPTPSIQGIGGFCPGESTQLTAPPGFASYDWSTGSTETEITVGSVGDLSLTVTDENGCAGSTTRNITEYGTTEPMIAGELQFCPGESTTLTGESGFSSYTWSTGSAETSITTSLREEVTLTVVDANGCETSNSVTLSNFVVTPPSITAPVGFCEDATATLTGEAGYTSYVWSNNSTDPSITVSDGGVYELSVTDANGCPSDNAVDVVAYSLPNPQIGGSSTFCTGLSTILNAGDVYADYLWSDGSDTPEITVNTPGTIGLTVTDANGCVGSASQEIIEAQELSPVVSGPRQFCAGQSTALSAGNGFATYDWSTGATDPGITVTIPGMYTVSVTDAGGCSGETTVEVVENALPLVDISGVTAFCDGAASELEGTPGYATYRWSTGAPTTSITVMDPDNYGLTITDANGCVDSASVTVTSQPLPSFTLAGDREFCAGATTDITVTPAYANYQWNTGDTLQTVSLATTQIAAVTVTDEFGCENTGSVSVNSVALPVPDAGPERLLDCDNRLTPIGTTSEEDWSYQWSGPGITATNTDQQRPNVGAAGTYTLVVTDNELGCESEPVTTEVVDLEYVPQIVLEVLDVLDCATSSVLVDGRGSASGSPYIYQWYDGNQQPIAGANNLFFNATTAQFYYLEVLDTITGCENISGIEVEEDLTYPLAEAGPGQLLTCETTSVELDGSDSQIGGQISYQWRAPDGGIISPSDEVVITVNQPGWYFLEITDIINDCSNTDSVFVNQDVDLPLAQAGQNFELDCNVPETTLNGTGSSTGSIFTYQWLNGNRDLIEGATSLQLQVNIPDDYILQVTNTENGCVDEDVVVISINEEAPRALQSITQVPTCAGDEDGIIILARVEGGIPPFSYSFNGAPFSGNIIYEDLAAGDFQVVVEDATGCQLTTMVTLNDGNDLTLDLGPDQYINYGETVDIYPNYSVDSTQLSQIDWLTNVGTLPCSNCLNHVDLEVPTSQQFFLTLVDENGCEVRDDLTVYVRRESNIFVPNVFSPNDDGDNDFFYIFADESLVEINSFLVFNRWGETVFEVYGALPNDPNWGWDGKHRGLPVNPAVYVWMAEVELDTGEVIVLKGDVTIMR